jgi:hypothetical protein
MFKELALSGLPNSSHLSFPFALKDGTTIVTIGEASVYFAGLTSEQRETGHWTIAIRMLNNAMKEPNYLKTATMSLQTALLLDGVLVSPHPLDNH